ncbi:Uncharacterised protein [Mycobacteroides abscessus subsp. abscessus]|nr:Uncharacterised protein [Mycobacteroides abscessus subsp. abscessus]
MAETPAKRTPWSPLSKTISVRSWQNTRSRQINVASVDDIKRMLRRP